MSRFNEYIDRVIRHWHVIHVKTDFVTAISLYFHSIVLLIIRTIQIGRLNLRSKTRATDQNKCKKVAFCIE